MMKKVIYTLIFSLAILFIACEADNATTTDGNFASETGQSGSLARFTILNDYLYTVDNQKLNVFNISNRENPVFVNAVNVGFDIETLFAYKTYLYIGSRNGMFIYDAVE